MSEEELIRRIKFQEPPYETDCRGVPADAMNMIQCMLTKDPIRRPTAKQVRNGDTLTGRTHRRMPTDSALLTARWDCKIEWNNDIQLCIVKNYCEYMRVRHSLFTENRTRYCP